MPWPSRTRLASTAVECCPGKVKEVDGICPTAAPRLPLTADAEATLRGTHPSAWETPFPGCAPPKRCSAVRRLS